MRLQGFIPLPKSSSKKRIVSNAELFDFELSADDIVHLDSLDEGRFCNSPEVAWLDCQTQSLSRIGIPLNVLNGGGGGGGSSEPNCSPSCITVA
jgi:hypothetical protein